MISLPAALASSEWQQVPRSLAHLHRVLGIHLPHPASIIVPWPPQKHSVMPPAGTDSITRDFSVAKRRLGSLAAHVRGNGVIVQNAREGYFVQAGICLSSAIEGF